MTFYPIDLPGPGRLATMAHPPGGAALPDAMTALAGAGAGVLVSALCADEAELLALTDQPAAAAAAGLEYVNVPIPDRTAPPATATAGIVALADRLAAQLRQGRFVITHCRAGIGRCSMLAGAVLVRSGTAPATAWELIRAARGLPVPDNPVQEGWLYRFAAAGAESPV